MKLKTLIILVLLGVITTSCFKIELLEDTGIRYSTVSSTGPADTLWTQIGLAKEIININEQLVYISGGENPVAVENWDDFKPRLPWLKNIDRQLLFDSTYFYRSPGVSSNCTYCEIHIDYKQHTWVKLAEIVGITYIPDETSLNNVEPGHLKIQTIEKCQLLYYEAGSTVYDLMDNKGNYYIMHATENGNPTTDVDLPEGWTISTRVLSSPFTLGPFGGGDNCYFNIVGDHLGQGYHQYIYANDYFPE